MEIKERIEELKREIQFHNNRMAQANQIAQRELQEMIAKQGAVLELQKLLKETPEVKEEVEVK